MLRAGTVALVGVDLGCPSAPLLGVLRPISSGVGVLRDDLFSIDHNHVVKVIGGSCSSS